MKLTKMIYVASPYSSHQKYFKKIHQWYRYWKVTKLIAHLQDLYPYAFIGPITQSHHTAKFMKNGDTGFKSWEKRDLTYISRCDEVWVLMINGWRESVGVTEEIEFAKENKILVRYFSPTYIEIKARIINRVTYP